MLKSITQFWERKKILLSITIYWSSFLSTENDINGTDAVSHCWLVRRIQSTLPSRKWMTWITMSDSRLKWKPASLVRLLRLQHTTVWNYNNEWGWKSKDNDTNWWKPPLWCSLFRPSAIVISTTCYFSFFYTFVLHLFIAMCTSKAEPGSIGALYSKSNFICFMPRNKPSEKWAHKVSVRRQIIKPQGQRAGFILDTMSVCRWPFICTLMKTDRDFAVNCYFSGHAVHSMG